MSRLPAVYYDTSATSTEYVRDWRDFAECLDEDPEMFYPGNRDTAGIAAAKAVCARCPVDRECGNWAITQGIDAGIWGGMDEATRLAKRREAGIPPAAMPDPCGTEAAARRHQRDGERACQTCLRAAAVRKADREAEAAAKSAAA